MADPSLPNRRAPVFESSKPPASDPHGAEPSPPPKKKLSFHPVEWARHATEGIPRWSIFLGMILSGMLFVGGVSYGILDFLRTDTGVRTWLLPRIATRFGIEIEAEKIDWQPLSYIRIKNLKLGPKNSPFLVVRELESHFDGWKVLRGELDLSDVKITAPTLRVKWDEQSKWSNWDSTTEAKWKEFWVTHRDSLHVHVLDVTGIDMRCETPQGDFTLENGNFKVKNLRVSQTVDSNVEGDFEWKPQARGVVVLGEKRRLKGHLKSVLLTQVDQRFSPGSLDLGITASDLRGQYEGIPMDGMTFTWTSNLGLGGGHHLWEAHDVRLTLLKQNEILLNLTGEGTIAPETYEGTWKIATNPIQSVFLNRLLSPWNLDVQKSSIAYKGKIQVAKNIEKITANGQWDILFTGFNSDQGRGFSLPNPIKMQWENQIILEPKMSRMQLGKGKMDAQMGGKSAFRLVHSKPVNLDWDSRKSPILVRHEPFECKMDILSVDPTWFLPDLAKAHGGWSWKSAFLEGNWDLILKNWGSGIDAAGSGVISELNLKHPHHSTPKNLTLLFDGSWNLNGLRSINWQKGTFKIRQGKDSLLVASLDAQHDFALNAGKGRAQFHFSRVEPFLTHLPSGFDIVDGEGTGILDWKATSSEDFDFKIESEWKKVSLRRDAMVWNDMDLSLSTEGVETSGILKLKDVELQVQKDGQLLGALKGNLAWNSKTTDSFADYQLDHLGKDLIAPLMAPWIPPDQVRQFEGRSEGSWTCAQGIYRVSSTNQISKLLISQNPKFTFKPLAGTIISDVTWNPDRLLEVHHFGVHLDPKKLDRNVIELTGYTQSTPELNRGDYHLSGKSLDLSEVHEQLFPALMQYARSHRPEDRAQEADNEIPHQDYRITLDIDSLKIQRLSVADIKIPILINDQQLSMIGAQIRYGGAPVQFSLAKDGGGNDSQYRFTGNIKGLSTKTALSSLLPEPFSSSLGRISFRTYGMGKGSDWEAFLGNLKASIDQIELRQASLEKLPFMEKCLEQLSSILRAPDAVRLRFEEAKGAIDLKPGNNEIQTISLTGPDVKLVLNGSVSPGQRLRLEGDIVVRKSLLRGSILSPYLEYAPVSEGWVLIPEKVRINGTWDDPRIRLDINRILRRIPPRQPSPQQPNSWSGELSIR